MSLKLDFNERADSVPKWLNGFSPDINTLWKYPNRQKTEVLIAQKFNTFAICRICLQIPAKVAISPGMQNIEFWGNTRQNASKARHY